MTRPSRTTPPKRHRERLEAMLAGAESWYGGLPTPPDFDLDAGETIFFLLPGAELIELRDDSPPLIGGSGGFTFRTAADQAAPGAVMRRSIWIEEAITARDAGMLVITNRRVTLIGTHQTHGWALAHLQDLTHDENVPETWISVSTRKRVSGFRYPAAASADLRFCLALALATARGERALLAASVSQQLAALPVERSKSRTAARIVKRVYLGRPGASMPVRLLQGAGAGLLTMILIGAAVPSPDTAVTQVSATTAGSTQHQSAETDAARRDREAGATAAQALADKAAADKATLDQAAAEQAAADTAAAQKLAAARVAAARVAAARVAAAKVAAARAVAARAAADKAASDRAAAEAAAAAAAPLSAGNCTAAYPDFCIPERAGDAYNCADFAENNFTALPADPYRLDRDGDGLACES